MTTTAVTAAGAPAATATPATSLSSLAGNFNDFLKLLMTQLQNQDPTSPMDTNQFTNQLVQFASVEQQIDTNSSLTKLIQASQGSTLLQSSALVGQTLDVSSSQLSLQNGTADVRFDTTSPTQVTVGVFSASGAKLREDVVTTKAGSNDWTWDGKDANGVQLPDGAYTATVKAADGTDVPFTVRGTATAVTRVDDALKVQMGALGVDFGSVQSVGAK